ncbi:MAG: hypothetical protein GXO66_09645, partial [Euryarchaeota archaeon]|nr:hypothetical protein [Euryarchaeota archaeon]
MKAAYSILLLVLLALTAGCAQEEKVEPEKERIVEAKEIQKSFEEAYEELRRAIEAGDAQRAEEAYRDLKATYLRAREKAGEQHLQFMVAEEDLRRLG